MLRMNGGCWCWLGVWGGGCCFWCSRCLNVPGLLRTSDQAKRCEECEVFDTKKNFITRIYLLIYPKIIINSPVCFKRWRQDGDVWFSKLPWCVFVFSYSKQGSPHVKRKIVAEIVTKSLHPPYGIHWRFTKRARSAILRMDGMEWDRGIESRDVILRFKILIWGRKNISSNHMEFAEQRVGLGLWCWLAMFCLKRSNW